MTQQSDLQNAIYRGIAFLDSQYNPDTGLLREAPRPLGDVQYNHNHYLTNDNALAAFVLETLDAKAELSAKLRASMLRYGYDHNGFIETAWGVPVRWPPFHHLDVEVQKIGADHIWQETHVITNGLFYDWSSYSNLAFMAALNEYNLGYHESALRLHRIEMASFDGHGWPDKAYEDRGGVYETLGVAWALYTGVQIGAPMERVGPQLVEVLLRQQEADGGFNTHYRAGADRLALPNVETTSMSLLALNAWLHRNTAPPDLPVVIQHATEFLQAQYNFQTGLLRESPVSFPHRYWLNTDNRLVSWALAATGQITLATTLSDTLRAYDDPRHGLIEALRGECVAWPPYTETQTLVATVGAEQIWLETRLSGAPYKDWEEYADLALYGALEAHNRQNLVEARSRYATAIAMFDGIGFADVAFRKDGKYATYKLALAIYVAKAVGEEPDPDILRSLILKQAPPGASEMGMPYAGGFYTLYSSTGLPVGDPNTETTAYAMLALTAQPSTRCGHRVFLPLSGCETHSAAVRLSQLKPAL